MFISLVLGSCYITEIEHMPFIRENVGSNPSLVFQSSKKCCHSGLEHASELKGCEFKSRRVLCLFIFLQKALTHSQEGVGFNIAGGLL